MQHQTLRICPRANAQTQLHQQHGSHLISGHAAILNHSFATLTITDEFMDPLAVLAQLGHTLPAPPVPGGNYTSAKTSGSIVYLSGVISQADGSILTGIVGLDRTVDDGYAAARSCALLQLAVLQQHLGSLSKVRGILTVNGYVNSVPGFADSPKVINGASDLFLAVFGEAGRHVRAAIGVSGLPRHALVELQMTVEI
jgi:enamine deaminase RidA (YjgF/YER057c/UK114 family)